MYVCVYLQEWNPDILTVPGTYGRYASLKIFDYVVRTTCVQCMCDVSILVVNSVCYAV
jgi:hypothetical protein